MELSRNARNQSIEAGLNSERFRGLIIVITIHSKRKYFNRNLLCFLYHRSELQWFRILTL